MFGLINKKKTKTTVINNLGTAATKLYLHGDDLNRKMAKEETQLISDSKFRRKQLKLLLALTNDILAEVDKAFPSSITIKNLLSQVKDIALGGKVRVAGPKSNFEKTRETADQFKEDIAALTSELNAIEAKLNNKNIKLSKIEFEDLFLRAKQLRTEISMKYDDYEKTLKTNDNLHTASIIKDREATNKEIRDINDSINVNELKEAASTINETTDEIDATSGEIDKIVGDVSNASNESFEYEYEKYLEGKATDKLNSKEPEATKATGSKAKAKTKN